MSTRFVFKPIAGLALLALTLTACQSQVIVQTQVVEVPEVVQVIQTQVVEQTVEVPATQTPAPHPILGDARVRQAIAYCTNRAELLGAVYPWLPAEERAKLEMNSFIPRGHWAYAGDDPNFARYPFDPAKGAALLDEAGWTLAEGAKYRANAAGDILALTLTTTEAEFRKAYAATFETQMAACGLQLIRFHASAVWFFGDTTGLRRRDFELAAFAWAFVSDPGGDSAYQCDYIPTVENNWQGQNYMGWCNPQADRAIRAAMNSLFRATRREAYRAFQVEFTHDVPSLPLFSRMDVTAINPNLQNLTPNVSERYFTWNAAQWTIPGKDTIVIGEGSEPASLEAWETAYVAQLIRRLVAGVDYTNLDFDYPPVMLKQMPTVENGGAVNNVVGVRAGEKIVDVDGNVVELQLGVRIRNLEGQEVVFEGNFAQMKQLRVTYEFVAGLKWSDGVPVTKADYDLSYRIECDPAIIAYKFIVGASPCDQIASVEFLSDTAYRVTWKPGYQEPLYFLPPFSRQPAHQVLSDGRKLADVPAAQWSDIREVRETPLGVGPYVINRWENGQHITLAANLHYFQGPPATPNIIVKFVNLPLAALRDGEVDVLGLDTVFPVDAEALLQLQAEGKARVFFTPSTTYEHIDFLLVK